MNPWTALMQTPRSRPGDFPKPQRKAALRDATATEPKAAAALVVTHGNPALVPVIVVEFL